MFCKPTQIILLVSVGGVLYNMLTNNVPAIASWIMTGVVGTLSFEVLCMTGLEPLAWMFMMLPVLATCFFVAVALFASSVRIETVGECPGSGGCRDRDPDHCTGYNPDHCTGYNPDHCHSKDCDCDSQ